MILTHYDAAFHIRCEKQESFEDGEKQGVRRGIFAMVNDNLEERVPMERTLQKLQKHFQLTLEEAQKWVYECMSAPDIS